MPARSKSIIIVIFIFFYGLPGTSHLFDFAETLSSWVDRQLPGSGLPWAAAGVVAVLTPAGTGTTLSWDACDSVFRVTLKSFREQD